jgi:hypothetical protein
VATDISTLLAGKSVEEIQAIIAAANGVKVDLRAQARAEAKAERDALHAAVVAAIPTKSVQGIVAALLTHVGVRKSTKEGSNWHGCSFRGMPVTVKGRQYTLSLTLTDVAASAGEAEAV